jgi:hypothetical protein
MRAAVVPRASTVPDASSSTHSRRGFTAASLAGVVLGVAPRKRARAEIVDVFADAPPSPESGACADCVGEYHGYLNTCDRARTSCVSSQNDDSSHIDRAVSVRWRACRRHADMRVRHLKGRDGETTAGRSIQVISP